MATELSVASSSSTLPSLHAAHLPWSPEPPRASMQGQSSFCRHQDRPPAILRSKMSLDSNEETRQLPRSPSMLSDAAAIKPRLPPLKDICALFPHRLLNDALLGTPPELHPPPRPGDGNISRDNETLSPPSSPTECSQDSDSPASDILATPTVDTHSHSRIHAQFKDDLPADAQLNIRHHKLEEDSEVLPPWANISISSTVGKDDKTKVYGLGRRNVIALDAPIQARHYISPSATSRKDGGGKKRSVVEDDLPEDQVEARAASKRFKNTMLARASRERKRQHIDQLEGVVLELTEKRNREQRKREAITAYAFELARRAGVSTVPEPLQKALMEVQSG